MGKNQIEIKDNHGHTTQVHHRDVKKVPMTDKVCKLYEEEQVGKTREGRKAVSTNKMPDLGWDITETLPIEETQRKNNMILTLQTIVTLTIMITTVLKQITACIGKIAQTVKDMTTKASRNIFFQNIKDFYRTATLVVSIATNTTYRTSRDEITHRNNRNSKNYTNTWKINDEYDQPYQSCSTRSHSTSSN